MTEEYAKLHLQAVMDSIEELEDEELNNLVLECVKELYSREKRTEQEYVKELYE